MVFEVLLLVGWNHCFGPSEAWSEHEAESAVTLLWPGCRGKDAYVGWLLLPL